MLFFLYGLACVSRIWETDFLTAWFVDVLMSINIAPEAWAQHCGQGCICVWSHEVKKLSGFPASVSGLSCRLAIEDLIETQVYPLKKDCYTLLHRPNSPETHLPGKWQYCWLRILISSRAWRMLLFLQVHLVFMLCSLLRTSKLVGSLGFLITFLFGCLSLSVLIEKLPEPLQWFLSLFCPFAFNVGIAKVRGIIPTESVGSME